MKQYHETLKQEIAQETDRQIDIDTSPEYQRGYIDGLERASRLVIDLYEPRLREAQEKLTEAYTNVRAARTAGELIFDLAERQLRELSQILGNKSLDTEEKEIDQPIIHT